LKSLNANGLSMMHVAAQGDSANTLYYFHMMDLDLNKQDLRGSTPAHWACFTQSEVALSYLIQWNPDLTLQDNEGNTPLHVAIKAADAVDSSRVVRYLMVNGARTDISDDKGRTPIQLVSEI
jgi:palmitoyltransferase